MSIRTSFNPLGTLGGEQWRELDLSQAASSKWTTTELNPLGFPNGGLDNNKDCTRLASDNLVWFGYVYQGTSTSFNYSYGGQVPPRATKASATPAIEFWALGTSRRLRVTFNSSPLPVSAFWSDDDWATWEEVELVAEGGNYVVETPRPVSSLVISVGDGWKYVNGQILKVEVQ